MNDQNATSTSIDQDAIDTALPIIPAPKVMTKEEKIVSLKAQIAKLEVRLYNVENDIQAPIKAAKVVVLPEVGVDVLFNYGRKTPTTEPEQKVGRVVAIKPAIVVDGKTKPAQIKVQIGEGFDAEYVVIYLGQIVDAESEASAE